MLEEGGAGQEVSNRPDAGIIGRSSGTIAKFHLSPVQLTGST